MPRIARSKATLLDAAQLVADLHRPPDDGAGMFAVRLEVLRHQSASQQPWPAAVLREPLAAVIDGTDSDIYALAPSDLVLLCNNLSVDRVDDVVGRFTHLVDDTADRFTHLVDDTADDATMAADRTSPAPGVRITWYDLLRSSDVNALLTAAEIAVGAASRCHRQDALRPFTPADLPSLLERTQGLPLARMIKRRNVLQMRSLASLEPLFKEISLSAEAFQRTFAPDLELTADPALFSFLGAGFDDALLTYLLTAESAEMTRAAFGIGIGLRTLQSAPYTRFEAMFANRGDVFIKIQLDDILRNTDTFMIARNKFKDLGLKTVIDGVTLATFSHFDLGGLGADYIKVLFPRGRPFDATDHASRALLKAIGATASSTTGSGAKANSAKTSSTKTSSGIGRDRIICAQLETEELLKWTLSAGLSCFQGSLIDRWFGVQAAKDGRTPGAGAR